jgi:hypothetical protein
VPSTNAEKRASRLPPILCERKHYTAARGPLVRVLVFLNLSFHFRTHCVVPSWDPRYTVPTLTLTLRDTFLFQYCINIPRPTPKLGQLADFIGKNAPNRTAASPPGRVLRSTSRHAMGSSLGQGRCARDTIKVIAMGTRVSSVSSKSPFFFRYRRPHAQEYSSRG